MLFLTDGKTKDYEPELCRDQECSGDCALEPHYGFAGGYGLGGMYVCMRCWAVSDFVKDDG